MTLSAIYDDYLMELDVFCVTISAIGASYGV